MNINLKKPNLFIIGAAKAGTTSLYDILRQHPQVFFPFVKEPAYFCDEVYFSKGDQWFLETFFANVNQQDIRGEATSRYLYFGEKVAPRIRQFTQPDPPKFIAIFRDPAQLVYSFYWNSVREGRESLSFKEGLLAENERMASYRMHMENRGQILYAYSRVASYASQVNQYLKIFPKERFLFLLTEDLTELESLRTRLQQFLEIENLTETKKITKNESALPQNEKLHQWLRNRSILKEILKPLIPFPIRYKLKMAVLEKNLKEYIPPELDPELANSIRINYSEETKRLQDIIQRDLTKWLPI